MSISSVFTNISETLTDIVEASETAIDQAVVDDVKRKLQQIAQALDENRFADLEIDPSAFGDTSAASNLGYHHTKAHQVISDTLAGVLVDLERFRLGLIKAETLIGDADQGSAADLNKKTDRAAAVLLGATQHSEGDRRNHQSRNENLPTGGVHA